MSARSAVFALLFALVQPVHAAVATTVAGVPGSPGFADGPSLIAQFNKPTCVYVAGTSNHTIRRIFVMAGPRRSRNPAVGRLTFSTR